MISVAIVLYNTPTKMLNQAVTSVLASPLVRKLYLIDNSPVQNIPPMSGDRIEYIYTGKNLGYSKAHNLILLHPEKRQRYHLVMNPDVWFPPETLGKLYNYMETKPTVGLVMPKILNPDGSIQYHCKQLPSPFDLLIRRFLPQWAFRNSKEQFELRDSGYDKEMEVPYLNGSFMFLRSSELDRLGGFDERIFMYGEDLDLSRRMYEKSHAMFFPDAEIYHAHQRSSYKSLKPLLFHCHGMINYFNKWGWFFDDERKKVNRDLHQQLLRLKPSNHIKPPPPNQTTI